MSLSSSVITDIIKAFYQYIIETGTYLRTCIHTCTTVHVYIVLQAIGVIENLLFKDAMPVSFRSELFTSYILTLFKQ